MSNPLPIQPGKKIDVLRILSDSLEEAVGINPRFPIAVRVAPLLRRRSLKTNVSGIGTVHFRVNNSDRHVLHQIFAERCYDLSAFSQYASIVSAQNALLAQNKTPIIIDAGANIGASSVWFATQFPKCHIVAVEPAVENAALCRRNTDKLPNVSMVEAALGGIRGSVSIVDHNAEPIAFQVARRDTSAIPVVTIPELELLVPNGKLFIVKIDIEGFEADVFSGDISWLETVAVLIVEPHDWLLPGQQTSQAFQRAVMGSGFELIIHGENLVFVRQDRVLP